MKLRQEMESYEHRTNEEDNMKVNEMLSSWSCYSDSVANSNMCSISLGIQVDILLYCQAQPNLTQPDSDSAEKQ